MRASMQRLRPVAGFVAGTLAAAAVGAAILVVVMMPFAFPVALTVAAAVFVPRAWWTRASASVGPVAQGGGRPEAGARGARLVGEAGARPAA